MKSISMEDLQAKASQEDLNIIDVRTAEQYAAGHIPGAISIPLDDLENQMAILDKDKSYHLVCQMGIKSVTATHFLTEAGFDATNIEGGTPLWQGKLEQSV